MAKKKKSFIRFKEVNIQLLNVRSNPSTIDGLIIKVIRKGDIVECDKNFDQPDWDHVLVSPNIEGYCMKKFLTPATPDKLAGVNGEPIIIHTNKYKCDAVINDKENEDDNEEENK